MTTKPDPKHRLSAPKDRRSEEARHSMEIADFDLDLDSIARRLRTITQMLYDDVGEDLACCNHSDVVYPYFAILLDAIRTEATRIERYIEQP
jgi:hypothetical protein